MVDYIWWTTQGKDKTVNTHGRLNTVDYTQ